MLSIKQKKRLSLGFGILGVVLMGVDLLITGNFFSHIAELMLSSILCFILALILDRAAQGDETDHSGAIK